MTRNSGLVAMAFVVIWSSGCSCPARRYPPATMMAGLLGHATQDQLLTELRSRQITSVKCFMAPVTNDSDFRVPREFQNMCEAIFETDLSQGGHALAAKEAVAAIARKVGIRDLSELFDPEKQRVFEQAIQQEGSTIVDYVFYGTFVGTDADLQLQGKLVNAQAGPDFGQQVTILGQLNWKRLWQDVCDDNLTSSEWQEIIRDRKRDRS